MCTPRWEHLHFIVDIPISKDLQQMSEYSFEKAGFQMRVGFHPSRLQLASDPTGMASGTANKSQQVMRRQCADAWPEIANARTLKIDYRRYPVRMQDYVELSNRLG